MTAQVSKHTPALTSSTGESWRALIARMSPDDGTISVTIPTVDGYLVQVVPRFGRDRIHAGGAGSWVGWRVYLFDRPRGGARPFRLTGPDRRYRSALLDTVDGVAVEVERLLAAHPMSSR